MFGNTAMHLAAAGAKLESLNCLIKHNADLRAENNHQETPLGSARRFGHPVAFDQAGKIIKQLVAFSKRYLQWIVAVERCNS